MWTYYPDLLSTAVPRYTSYPTAADFGDIDPSMHRAALREIEGEVSLYVHIPFCEKICFYCGCNTSASGPRQRLESYLEALHREIAIVAALLPADARVRRVAFGGGSPNAIAPDDFLRLLEALTSHFGLTQPVLSIELDPRTLSKDWGATIRSAGIERASLGVQTFASHCQEAIGRLQPEDLILEAVDLLRAAGVASLNFDLMYGLPRQTTDDLLDTLQRTRVLGADRVALFGYAHVPHIVPRQRAIHERELPGLPKRFSMAQLGYAYFCTHGYVPVGFDHFARPGGDPLARAALAGSLHRNFQGFTDDDAPNLIGLGASAISSFPHLLVQNEKNTGRYRMLSSQDNLAARRGVTRTAEDRLRGALIERLLCHGEASLPPRVQREIEERIEPFVARGLASLENGRLSIDPDGAPYARSIAALLDTYRDGAEPRFSSAL